MDMQKKTGSNSNICIHICMVYPSLIDPQNINNTQAEIQNQEQDPHT